MPTEIRHELAPYFLTLEDLEGAIRWSEFFDADGPVELDIGCGRGLFIANAAAEHPGVNYLGLEMDFKEGRRAARRLRKRQLPNARILGGDARIALKRSIPRGSVSAAHVYFPDPWWKRRHLRRRLFNDEFVSLLAAVLVPEGLVHAWTDVEDYFQVISALMTHDPRFETLPPPQERNPQHDMDYHTSFERKGRISGREIWRGRWRKLNG